MTDLLGLLVAIVFLFTVNSFLYTRIARHDRDLARFFALAVFLRAALAAFINITIGAGSDFSRGLWGDSWTYDQGGWLVALSWSGLYGGSIREVTSITGYGFVYFVAVFYYVVGHNEVLMQFVNATIGGLSVVVIYAIGLHLFDVPVARLAARFMAFFPQVVFWSCAIYKDPAIQLCIGLAMYAVVRLGDRIQARHVALYVLACLGLMTLRFYVFYIVVFATLGTFVIAQRGRSAFGGLLAQVLLLGAFVGAFSLAAGSETVRGHSSYFTLERLQITRSDQVRWADSSFAPDADVSTPEGILTTLPVGLVYLFLAPFPWSGGGARQVIVIPEMLYWYTLLPSLAAGLMLTIRTRFRQALPILVFTAALTLAYAVFQGNVGTAYRQRTQITMFFFIFMAAGIVEKGRVRERAAAARAARMPQLTPAWRR